MGEGILAGAAVPLDLCETERLSVWLQKLPQGYRLGLVNWSTEEKVLAFDFSEYGLAVPSRITELWSGSCLSCCRDKVDVKLRPHQSAILNWGNA